MANHLRRDRRLRGKDTSLPPPSKRSPQRSTPQQLGPSVQDDLQENNSSPSQSEWLKKLLRIGK